MRAITRDVDARATQASTRRVCAAPLQAGAAAMMVRVAATASSAGQASLRRRRSRRGKDAMLRATRRRAIPSSTRRRRSRRRHMFYTAAQRCRRVVCRHAARHAAAARCRTHALFRASAALCRPRCLRCRAAARRHADAQMLPTPPAKMFATVPPRCAVYRLMRDAVATPCAYAMPLRLRQPLPDVAITRSPADCHAARCF